ncbi:MAG: 3-oxoacyl-ACP reductase FabG [Ruminococcus sp.]|nr:3-oxoacyl-ACP reductase FabG [Ruminococcus sp.]
MGIIKKAAIVTGGSGGIGSGICRRLARDGRPVAVCYNNSRDIAERSAQELRREGLSAAAIHLDLRDIQSIRECLCETEQKLGQADLLVNNAGTAEIGLFTDLTDERLTEIMETDLLGAMKMTREFIPRLISRHSGCIINISSVWGESGASCEVAYSAAKAGLIGFTKALAKELGPSGIRVNCISCGLIDTKMNSSLTDEDIKAIVDDIPAGRIGTPEDVAAAAAFLSSEEASYISGQVLRVDGCWL